MSVNLATELTVKLDHIDHQILGYLESNARESVSNIAVWVGLSRSSTHERIARLKETGVIKSFTIKRGDMERKAGISAYLLLYLQGPICAKIAKELIKIPEIRRSQSIGGEIDMILMVEAIDIETLNRVRNQVENIRGVVKVTTGIILMDRFDRS